MPGHVKRGGTGEPDPDPTEYLFITYEEKQKVARSTQHQNVIVCRQSYPGAEYCMQFL